MSGCACSGTWDQNYQLGASMDVLGKTGACMGRDRPALAYRFSRCFGARLGIGDGHL